MSIKSIIKEGKQARIKAEIDFANKGVPVKIQCVYKRPDARKLFLKGWFSLTAIDIDIEIMKAKGTLQNRTQFKERKRQLKQRLNH